MVGASAPTHYRSSATDSQISALAPRLLGYALFLQLTNPMGTRFELHHQATDDASDDGRVDAGDSSVGHPGYLTPFSLSSRYRKVIIMAQR